MYAFPNSDPSRNEQVRIVSGNDISVASCINECDGFSLVGLESGTQCCVLHSELSSTDHTSLLKSVAIL